MDLNQDGKHDWKDDAILYTAISSIEDMVDDAANDATGDVPSCSCDEEDKPKVHPLIWILFFLCLILEIASWFD